MNIKHLEYFITLAKEKSFSKASELLGITQPTLTQTVQKLESVLGSPLFDRSFPSLTLTPEGRVLLDSARKITDLWAQTCSQITELNHGITGSVKIGVAPFRASYTVPSLAADFRQHFPETRLFIRELRTDEMLDALDAGEIDLAVTACDKKNVSKYEAFPVFDEEVLVAVAGRLIEDDPRFPDEGELPTVDFSAFDGMDFIVLGSEQLLFRHYKTLCERSGCAFRAPTSCTSIETSLTLANAGAGAALVLSTGIEYYRDRFPRLRYFSVRPSLPGRTVYALTRKNQYLSTPAKYLLKQLEKTEVQK